MHFYGIHPIVSELFPQDCGAACNVSNAYRLDDLGGNRESKYLSSQESHPDKVELDHLIESKIPMRSILLVHYLYPNFTVALYPNILLCFISLFCLPSFSFNWI